MATGWLQEPEEHAMLKLPSKLRSDQDEDIRTTKAVEVGNLLNHPPAGILPNCIPMAFRWPTWSELGSGPGTLLAVSVSRLAVAKVRRTLLSGHGFFLMSSCGKGKSCKQPADEKMTRRRSPGLLILLQSGKSMISMHSGIACIEYPAKPGGSPGCEVPCLALHGHGLHHCVRGSPGSLASTNETV